MGFVKNPVSGSRMQRGQRMALPFFPLTRMAPPSSHPDLHRQHGSCDWVVVRGAFLREEGLEEVAAALSG
jgi:hypothetical protein